MLTRISQATTIMLAALCSTLPLAAETPYPSRTITMVVAYNAGGSTDLIARVLGQHIGSILGQTVIIENKGGADGAIGTAAVTPRHAGRLHHHSEHHQHARHQSPALQGHLLQPLQGFRAGFAGGAIAQHPGVEPEVRCQIGR